MMLVQCNLICFKFFEVSGKKLNLRMMNRAVDEGSSIFWSWMAGVQHSFVIFLVKNI